MRFVFFVSIAALLNGCASPTGQVASQLTPASPRTASASTPSAASVIARKYYPTLSCENLQPLDRPRRFQLALAGYRVGPTARTRQPDLKSGILRPFVSDGCSFSLNGNVFGGNDNSWLDCCVKHDILYWLGGTRDERRLADLTLKTCMSERSYSGLARFYAAVVRSTGSATSNKIYRWGYGWNFRRPYGNLNAAEEAQVRELYGGNRAEVAEKLFRESTQLAKYCDSFDPALRKLSAEEKKAYDALNDQLKNDDMIEWARWRESSSESRRLEVKLKSCEDPAWLTFARGTPDVLAISFGCASESLSR